MSYESKMDPQSDECAQLKNSNAELLDALKTLLAFVNSLGMEFGGVPKEKYLEAYEPLNKAYNAIHKVEHPEGINKGGD